MVRRTGEATREEIRTAATHLFRERGFARTSVRDIAALASSNPALVIRHFGTKELLFLETMHLTIDDEPLFDVPMEQFGERFIEVLLADDDIRGVYLALVRGSNEPQIRTRLQDIHEKMFVGPVRARLAGPDADIRARLAAAVVGGLLYVLWVVGDEALVAAEPRELVVRYGALLQQVLTERH
ncbi:putative TetR-family transcriptional regulator [Actinoplanes missouriensis 431]|uniref:Putative TetR-family transcriptional regulator n=1 Tax=Actinoplanes missouriensis (strain ATCC 14538 / DSM 43046 / CBS 188.64 / JCM 3121 / NBRC 102363 / NCIMB 12654 / NRRL B-3342 / UNCC 431) TaxID=512565 RepID=I0H1T8_ACTM4|nr:TetR family transcriptional regulator [Actinoplanes missouriensis]BAL86975.1 putative TetR-family transcriptional regulator [Actinoplanes missouriensis 431]